MTPLCKRMLDAMILRGFVSKFLFIAVCCGEQMRIVPLARIYLKQLCEDSAWQVPMQHALANLHLCVHRQAATPRKSGRKSVSSLHLHRRQ